MRSPEAWLSGENGWRLDWCQTKCYWQGNWRAGGCHISVCLGLERDQIWDWDPIREQLSIWQYLCPSSLESLSFRGTCYGKGLGLDPTDLVDMIPNPTTFQKGYIYIPIQIIRKSKIIENKERTYVKRGGEKNILLLFYLWVYF